MGEMKIEVRQERHLWDRGTVFPAWDIYINDERACTCFEQTRAKLIADALDAYQSGSPPNDLHGFVVGEKVLYHHTYFGDLEAVITGPTKNLHNLAAIGISIPTEYGRRSHRRVSIGSIRRPGEAYDRHRK